MKKVLSLLLSFIISFSCLCINVSAEDTVTEEKTTAQELLDGKKVLFIGDSYVYYGHSVKPNYNLTQSSRSNDKGGFYQLCKANGIDVSVTNWTFGSHGLSETFDGVCTETTCDAYTKGESHEDYLTDRNFDYVIVSPGRGANLETEFEYIMNFFRAANENVKFVCLGSMGIHGINKVDTTYPDMIAYYETLKKQGVIIADWGEMVSDIINGTATVEGATQIYDRSTFVVKDNYHPNLLAGYLTTLFAYCAITGEKATEQSYSYITDGTLVDFNSYLSNYFTNGDADTNFPEIMASEADMKGLQTLVDEYLAPRGKEVLDGKKVIFIGNSFVFRGLTVTAKYSTDQASRSNDKGYFYQLCKANGIDVSVTNWTYSGHRLGSIFNGACNYEECNGYGKYHEENLKDRYFDYVIFSPGSRLYQNDEFMSDVEYIMDFFKAANPDAKFMCLGTNTAYGNDSIGVPQPDITGNYDTLREMGVLVADWGKVVSGIMDGTYTVPGATQVYDAKSFLVTDGYHENMLVGYLTSLMAYCAITGETAVGQPYSFYNDTTLNSAFDIPAYLDKWYTSSGANETNADEIMESPSDMNGLQQIAQRVLSGDEEPEAEVKLNQLYTESFDNDTGESIKDLSVYGLKKGKNSGYEYVNTNGQLVIRKSSTDWTGLNSIVYNPSYAWEDVSYNVEVSGKNEMGNTGQYMTVYLDYKDNGNYYAVRIAGSKYSNGVYTQTSNVEIIKKANGVVTQLAKATNTSVTATTSFKVNIEKIDNTIKVYNDGECIVSATDSEEGTGGKYVAFGTENTRGYFDSITVSPMYVNKTYIEAFNNNTGARVTDLSEYGLTKAKSSGYEYVATDGNLYISKGDWTSLSSIMYNPSYTWTNSRYTVKLKAKNYFSNASGKYVTVYLNFKDTNNYYAVRIGGAAYDGGWVHTATVQIVKCVDGAVTVLAQKENSGITSEFNIGVTMLDNLITLTNGGKTVLYAKDEGEMITGKHIAFGTYSSRGYIDSISVTPMEEDKAFSEDFSDVDLADGNWVGADAATINSAGRLRITTNGKRVYNKDWKVYGNDFKLAYTTYNSYGSTSNKMNMYFKYQDSENYYRVSFGGAKYDSATGKFTTERFLVFTSKIDGVETTENYSLGYSSSTGKIVVVSEGSRIYVFVNGKLIVDKTDEMNMFMGGSISFSSTNYTGGWVDDISLETDTVKLYDGENRVLSLDGMEGKTVTLKKSIDVSTSATPIIAIKDEEKLYAIGIGEKSATEAVVNFVLPSDFKQGDVYMYLWSDMEEMKPLAEVKKIEL